MTSILKKISPLFLFLLLGFSVFAQDSGEQAEEKQGFDKSKLFLGGTFGLGFGSNSTYINVSPQLGYRFSPFFAAGAGVNFNYNSVNVGFSTEKFTYAGLNVFGRIYPIKYIVLHAQPELNYAWGKSVGNGGSGTIRYKSEFVPSLLLGGGANIPTGGANSAITIMYMYDAIGNIRSPYSSNPFLSVGFNVGL